MTSPSAPSPIKCPHCDQWISAPHLQQAAAPSKDDAAMRLVMPTGNISPLAVAAGYAGIFSIIVLPGPVALVLGILAIRDIKKTGKYGMGRAVFGLMAGFAATAALVAMFVPALF